MVLTKEEHILNSGNNIAWAYDSFVKNSKALRIKVTFEAIPEDAPIWSIKSR
jgi:hypothetical protein